MGLIPDELRERVRHQLSDNLAGPVRLLLFTQEFECKFCAETKQLIVELAGLSDKIVAEVHDFVADSSLAKELGVDRIPALVILGDKDYRVRFYGFPYGYEFQALMEVLASISRGRTDLSEETKTKLSEIKVPLHIQVFTSLTCPHCPAAAVLACKFAIENTLIRTEIIDAGELPHLVQKYAVVGVPKIIINEKTEFIGAVPENTFLEHLLAVTQ